MLVFLGSALEGIEKEQMPIDPVSGNAYEADLKQLPTNWSAAITAFEEGSILPKVFSETFNDLFVACKKQELSEFSRHVSDFEHQSYLDIV